MLTSRWPFGALALLSALPGCADTLGAMEDPEDATTSETADALETENALTANALTANALTANALTANALTSNPLTAAALTGNPLTEAALSDPLARDVLRYIVSCALPPGRHFTITAGTFTRAYRGNLGLAPSWGLEDGTCGPACRGWVSACVLSRLNYLGASVSLSLRGSHARLATTEGELAAFPVPEASYYGDIFASPQVLLACLAPGVTSDVRQCGPSLADCPEVLVGSCDDSCDGQQPDGAFLTCHSEARNNSGDFPSRAIAFPATASVFLEPAALAAGP